MANKEIHLSDIETDSPDIQVMYYISQIMDGELLDDDELRIVVNWFNDKYRNEGIK